MPKKILEHHIEEPVTRYYRNELKRLYHTEHLDRKMNGMGNRSWPDRMYIGPNKVLFVEFKKPGGEATEIQENRLKQLKMMGHAAVMIDDVAHGNQPAGHDDATDGAAGNKDQQQSDRLPANEKHAPRPVRWEDVSTFARVIPTVLVTDSSGNWGGLYRARGWWGGHAPYKDSYRRKLTHSSWVNTQGRWYQVIIEIMRHADGQPAERLHLLRSPQRPLTPVESIAGGLQHFDTAPSRQNHARDAENHRQPKPDLSAMMSEALPTRCRRSTTRARPRHRTGNRSGRDVTATSRIRGDDKDNMQL